MDLSHSSRHLPARLAVLVLCDGDKTPVSAPIGGGVGGGGGVCVCVCVWEGGGAGVGWEEDRARGLLY